MSSSIRFRSDLPSLPVRLLEGDDGGDGPRAPTALAAAVAVAASTTARMRGASASAPR